MVNNKKYHFKSAISVQVKYMTRIDPLTPEQRKKTMQHVKDKDTGPEMTIRRLVHKMGYRYGLHRKDLPGKPDMVFTSRKKIIFIHGCFWHGHNCKSGRKKPRTNENYWVSKIEKNKKRDVINRKKLKEMGWNILVIWECEINDILKIKNKIEQFLNG